MPYYRYNDYDPYPRRRRGFWATLFRLAVIAVLVVFALSGALWLLGIALGLVSTLFVLALMAAPFLFLVWLIWIVWVVILGK